MKPEPSIEVLSAYVDQELTGVGRQELEEHLRECETCRRRLEAMRQTVQAIHALPTEAPPRVFTIPAQRQQVRRWRPVGAWASGLAAVAIVGLIVTVALRPQLGGARSTTLEGAGNFQSSGGGTASSAHYGAAAPVPERGALDQSSKAVVGPTVSRRVVDPRDPNTTLSLVAPQAVASNGTLVIGISTSGRAASGTVHLSLVRNGYGVSFPGSVPAGQVSGSWYLDLSQLALPTPRTGQYELTAVVDLSPGDELIATVPVQLR